MLKKDIEKIKEIIAEIEPKCDYYENMWIDSVDIERAAEKIEAYLEGRGYEKQ